jgi:hypothetical protein
MTLKDQQIQAAILWITSLLKHLEIRFQIAGGLAAIAYGSTRELHDIDIDISEQDFNVLLPYVKSHISFGPTLFKDENWQLMLMTLTFNGIEIDISSADNCKIFNKNTQQWQTITADFSQLNTKNLFGLKLPIIPLASLIAYKTILGRPVDVADLKSFANSSAK